MLAKTYNMKQPSLNAIRRFKEQQERKKIEEQEKRIQEKLSTLEHRAAQGDRRAKSELKIIEKAKDERNRQQQELHEKSQSGVRGIKNYNDSRKGGKNNQTSAQNSTIKRPRKAETDFEELMRLAASNNNELRRGESKQPSPPPQRVPSIARKPRDSTVISNDSSAKSKPTLTRPSSSQPSTSEFVTRPQQTARELPQQQKLRKTNKSSPIPSNQFGQKCIVRQLPFRLPIGPNPPRLAPPRPIRNNYYQDEEDYDDDYEQDDFVVDEDDSEAHDEVSKTIRSVFGYDKRRCDLREAELDRQYRQIGRVSTFEDLEREERRASRLAAVEDAKELREEEERKRLKKIRLKAR